MSTERLVRQALEDSVKDLPCPEPDTAQLVAAGRAMRRRRMAMVASLAAAAVLVLVLAGLSFAWADRSGRALEPVPAGPPAPRPMTGALPEPVYLAGGVLRIGESSVVDDPRLRLFTALAEGVVYVEDASGLIVWRSWSGDESPIGSNPWPAGSPEVDGGVAAVQRDVVGNPTGDHVAWIETVGDRRGDLLLVQGSTGRLLARTALPGPAEEWYDIRFVDERSVYLRRCVPVGILDEDRRRAGLYPGQGPDNSSGSCELWVWDWTVGSQPRNTGRPWHAPEGGDVLEVGTGAWATETADQSSLAFVTPEGRTLATVPAMYTDNYHGNALSPDGRFWYGDAYRSFVDTRTGEVHDISGALAQVGVSDLPQPAGWMSATTLAFSAQGGIVTCDVITLICSDEQGVGALPPPVRRPVVPGATQHPKGVAQCPIRAERGGLESDTPPRPTQRHAPRATDR